MKRSPGFIATSALAAIALAACGSSHRHALPNVGSTTHARQQAAPGEGSSSATVLHVGRWPGLHHTYRTIQSAVDAAHPGDRILIAAGDYHERPNADVGVRIATPDITIEGVNRNTVIVDGTRPGAPSPCDADPRFQNFGPVVHQSHGALLNGRNGIVIDHASGVTVENLTVCNFVGTKSANTFGNQLWFNGGAATGKTGLGAYHVADVTTTSTYIRASAGPQQAAIAMAAYAGILISNATGPGRVTDSYASNMADSGFHIAGCPDCNTVFDHDTAQHNDIGFSATDAGGRLRLENSVFEHNGAGVNLASENNEDAPPPQDGACPPGMSGPEPIAPGICTVIEHNTVHANNNADVSRDAAEVLLGAGIDIAGGKHDLVFNNDVSDQGSYGIVTTVFASIRSGGFPNADCQMGRPLPAGGCFFNATGNLIADNKFQHDGTFANPTNGDLADATVADSTPNCYRSNTDQSGRPTVAPQRLQVAQKCAPPRGDTFFGVLGVEVLCAVRAFGDTFADNGNATNGLTTLSRLFHTSFDPSAIRNARAIYPSPGNYVAPRPAPQPSLHP